MNDAAITKNNTQQAQFVFVPAIRFEMEVVWMVFLYAT